MEETEIKELKKKGELLSINVSMDIDSIEVGDVLEEEVNLTNMQKFLEVSNDDFKAIPYKYPLVSTKKL